MPIIGFVDRISAHRIRGWAFDSDAPDWHVEVTVRLGDEIIGYQKAEFIRIDLKNADIGDGDHGFDLNLNRKIKPTDLSRVTVTAVAENAQGHPLTAAGRWGKESAGYSQGGEDLVLERIFRNVPNGIYVDVGCNYPVHHNNTYLLYQKGWSGLCIDPHVSLAAFYAKERPRDTFIPLAVSSRGSEVQLHYSDYLGVSSMHPGGPNSHSMAVPSKPLTEILREHNVPAQFELLSIDVEGAELEVLDSLDLQAFRPRIVVVEFNMLGQINLDLQPRLIRDQYHIIAVTRWNLIATANFTQDCWMYPEGFQMFEDA